VSSSALEISFDAPSGETITMIESQSETKNTLFINLSTHRGISSEFMKSMPAFSKQDINVWTLDLVNSYMLTPSKTLYNQVPLDDMSAIINKAKDDGFKNVYLYSISNASNFALKISYHYQQNNSNTVLKGHIMHVPHLWITNLKTGKTTPTSISATSNLPIYLIMTEFGTKFHHTETIVDILSLGGSPVFVQKIKGIRSGFLLRPLDHLEDQDIEMREKIMPFYKFAANILLKSTPAPFIQTPNLKSTVREYDNKLVKVINPKKAPTLILPTYSGKEIDMSDYIGSVVLVNFWATWCAPCVKEIPSMVRLSDKIDNKFEVLMVNIGESKIDISKFKEDVIFDFPILMDITGNYMKKWGVYVYPSNFIIDKSGKVVYTYTGSIEWDRPDIIKEVSALLSE
jgi:thiol-disulfide isomerase/thioredoxin